MVKYFIKTILFPYLLLFILIVQNAEADIFSFQHTPPSKLAVSNNTGASYLFINGIFILPGNTKYIGPDWAGTPGIGCNVSYGRCFWRNIGADIDIVYGAIEAAYNDKTDKGIFGRAGVNVSFNIFNGETRDSLNNILYNRPSVTLSAGYGWNGYSFGMQNIIDTTISAYTQPAFNFEDSWHDIPFVLSVNLPISLRIEMQPYCKIVYQINSLYYCVPVVEYDSGINEYRWNSQEYEQRKDIWVFDYGFVMGLVPFNKMKSLKIYSGCSFSKANDQKESNISLSFGLMKEWGKKYK